VGTGSLDKVGDVIMAMSMKRSMVRRVAVRVGVSSMGEICGRAVNILLPFIVITIHGANTLTDSFFLAMACAFFVQGTLANVCITALVPEFIRSDVKRNLVKFLRLAIVAGVIASLISAVLIYRPLSMVASVVSSFSIALIAISGLIAAPATAALNAQHRYAMPGLTWGLRMFPVLTYMVIWPHIPLLHWLLAGIALADYLRMVILLWLAREWLAFKEEYEPLCFPQAAQYLIIAAAIAGVIPLVMRWIASTGHAGTVSLFEAAERIYSIVASLATIGVGNVTLVYLARINGTKEESSGWRMIVRSAIVWSLLWLFIGVLLWVLFPLISQWIHLPPETSTSVVRNCVLLFVLGMPGFILTGIISRRLITLGLSRALIFITAVGVVFSIVGGIFLFPIFDIVGIAAILSLNQYLIALLMFHKLTQHLSHAHSYTG